MFVIHEKFDMKGSLKMVILHKVTYVLALVLAILSFQAHSATAQRDCPDILNHTFKRLHSSETVDLCQSYKNKPILIINAASFCGFTPQFKELEALYQEFKDQGLVLAGFPSNDFKQEASSEQKTAEVCYKNYGVSFDMFTKISVKGPNAHPLFKSLADQSQSPKWNFNKYLIDKKGNVIKYFPSSVKPSDLNLRRDIIQALE